VMENKDFLLWISNPSLWDDICIVTLIVKSNK
jgi:hypothetical protein